MNFQFLLLMSMALLVAAASSLTACDRRNPPTPTTVSSGGETVADNAKADTQALVTSPSPSGGARGDTVARPGQEVVTVYVKPPYGASAPVASGSDGVNKPVVHGGVDQPPIVVPPAPSPMASGVATAPEALVNGAPPAAGQMGAATLGPLSDQERAFVVTALDAAMSELRLSQLAAQKASNSVVKSYAALLITDHGTLVDGLQRLARQRGVQDLPAWSDERQRMLDNLARSGPESFDQAYLRAAGSAQNQALVALFEKADREARDPAVKALVQSALPGLKAHLSASEQMPVLG
jgi:putative membrane protein